ncbi:MAG TPA: Ku protein [Polyangia bacterium]|jgi:DNA end-binding protein Ku|nr:Ku protein [Polyangia bacterium]
MARAIWNGAISFGLVTIPVQLVSAVRSQRPRFHLLHEKDEAPVRYERVCQREGKPVPWGEIVKGYEFEKGEYAVLTKEDFKRAALEKTDTIDVLSFVPAGAIDPRYFETPYYLAPGKGADRAYALLRETIRKAGKVGVTQLILRQSQHLAALSVKDDIFVLTLLRLADDLAATDSVKAPSGKGLRDSELQLAARLVDGLAGPWAPEQYKDQYAANLSAIIKAKIKGRGSKPRLGAIGPGAPNAGVVDLMERLRQSLAVNTNARAKPRGAGGKSKSKRSKSGARSHRRAA